MHHADRAAAIDSLHRVGERARPVALARERTLPVAAPLAGLVPGGALQRGASVSVDGAPGATSLALALMAEASASGSWVGVVGDPSLGLAAVAEAGLALERVVVVDPPPSSWAAVVAALLDAVDLVCTRSARSVRPADARRLVARAREQGAVWVQLPAGGRAASAKDRMPPAEVRLSVVSAVWEGPAGGGAGRLERRRVEVVGGGRGAAARERRASLWLPGPDGRVAAAAPLVDGADHPAAVPRLVAG